MPETLRRGSWFPQQWVNDQRDPSTVMSTIKRRESTPAAYLSGSLLSSDRKRQDSNQRRVSTQSLALHQPQVAQFFTEEDKEIVQKRSKNDLLKNKADKHRNTPWIVSRMAYSREVVHFSLPINYELLHDLTPLEYLVQYIRIEDRREKFYKLMWDFKRQRKRVGPSDSDYRLQGNDVYRAISELWRKHVTAAHYETILQILYLDEASIQLNQSEFIAFCGFVERFMFEENRANDATNKKNIRFGTFNAHEMVDFCSMYKLSQFKINESLCSLFKFIQSTHRCK